MAEIGLGYGSEYQLLRYLGHHRIELNDIIKNNTKLDGELIWLDFPKDLKALSLDGEYAGLDFLNDNIVKGLIPPLDIIKLLSNWKGYWSSTGRQPNWDGVILHKKDDQFELVIVEAKAHLKEIESKTKSNSNQDIQNAFQDTQNNFGICNGNWFGKYYQLANRLAFVNFLHNNGIEASLLYIYFINGYEKRQLNGKQKITVEDKCVPDEVAWNNVIADEYIDLGINAKAKQYISKIFINCK